MDAILIIALVLFLIQVVAWIVLPSGKSVSEAQTEFSSIGDEKKSTTTTQVA
jgi:hypothetical protein